MSEHCFTAELNIYDNTDNTCVSCKTFNGAWIYCPVFNHLIADSNIKFDETGEKHGCELYS